MDEIRIIPHLENGLNRPVAERNRPRRRHREREKEKPPEHPPAPGHKIDTTA